MIKEILITGHTGFIGQELTCLLDSMGINWKGVSKSSGYDLTQDGALKDLEKFDFVIHLASKTDIQESFDIPQIYHEVNKKITINVMEYSLKHRVPVIFLSSYMYGKAKSYPINEKCQVSCLNPYAESKRECEIVCEFYSKKYNLPIIILRVFNLFGPNQPTRYLIPKIISQILSFNKVVLHKFETKRDYLWITDLVEAIYLIINKPFKKKLSIYNLGYGKSISNLDVARELIEQFGHFVITEKKSQNKDLIPDTFCDNSLFVEDYGWSPKISFKSGILKILEKKINIAYYTFGNSEIGMGHLYRGLNIAQEISEWQKLWNVTFIISKETETSYHKVKQDYPYFDYILDNECLSYYDVIIVDRLSISNLRMKELKEKCSFVISIDNSSKSVFESKLAINTLYECKLDKPRKSSTEFWQGIENTLISKEFFNNRYVFREKVEKLLIMQGSSDVHKVLKRLVPIVDNILLKNGYTVEIHIITAATFDGVKELTNVLKHVKSKVIWHNAVKNTSLIYSKMDLAISSAGVSSHELAICYVPAILITEEKKELETARLLDEKGIAINVGQFSLLNHDLLEHILYDAIKYSKIRKRMYNKAKDLIKGNTTKRLIQYIRKNC